MVDLIFGRPKRAAEESIHGCRQEEKSLILNAILKTGCSLE